MAPLVLSVSKKTTSLVSIKKSRKRENAYEAGEKEFQGKHASLVYAEICEELRREMEKKKFGKWFCPKFIPILAEAIRNCNWMNSQVLGKTIQNVYDKNSPRPVQVIILNREGKPLYYDKNLKLFSTRLFYVTGKNYFAGILNLNQYFKTNYFCHKCIRKFSNKKNDLCVQFPLLNF